MNPNNAAILLRAAIGPEVYSNTMAARHEFFDRTPAGDGTERNLDPASAGVLEPVLAFPFMTYYNRVDSQALV